MKRKETKTEWVGNSNNNNNNKINKNNKEKKKNIQVIHYKFSNIIFRQDIYKLQRERTNL